MDDLNCERYLFALEKTRYDENIIATGKNILKNLISVAPVVFSLSYVLIFSKCVTRQSLNWVLRELGIERRLGRLTSELQTGRNLDFRGSRVTQFSE